MAPVAGPRLAETQPKTDTPGTSPTPNSTLKKKHKKHSIKQQQNSIKQNTTPENTKNTRGNNKNHSRKHPQDLPNSELHPKASYPMLHNSASGPDIGLPGRNPADVEAFPTRIRPKSGPEDRSLARKHYCVTSCTSLSPILASCGNRGQGPLNDPHFSSCQFP